MKKQILHFIKQTLDKKEITSLNSLQLNIKQRLDQEITSLNSLNLNIKQRLDEKEVTSLNSLNLNIKQRMDEKEVTSLNSLKLNIKQRLDEKEITSLNSLKLNIKKIWRELDSNKSIPRCLAAVIVKGGNLVYKEYYQNKVWFWWNLNQSSIYITWYQWTVLVKL